MDTTESMDSLANPVIAALQPDQLPNSYQKPRISARAKHHPETVEPPDRKEPMDHQAMEVPQALMENQAIKEHVDHPAHRVQVAHQERKAHPVHLVPCRRKKLVHPAQPDLTANPADPAPQAKLAKLVKMAAPVLEALPVTLALQAVLARTAAQAAPAKQANPAHPAAAITAHQLVWLQVIKYRLQDRLAINNNIDRKNNFNYDQQQIAKNKPSLIYYLLLLVLTQTFHVKKVTKII